MFMSYLHNRHMARQVELQFQAAQLRERRPRPPVEDRIVDPRPTGPRSLNMAAHKVPR